MSFFIDPSVSLSRFENGVKEIGDEYPCLILQWRHNESRMSRQEIHRPREINDINSAPLTIIIAPPDYDNSQLLAGYKSLAGRFSIPGAFIEERCQNVLNSFGHFQKEEYSTYSWLHYLLKEVEREDEIVQKQGHSKTGLWRLTQLLGKSSNKKTPLQSEKQSDPGQRIPFRFPEPGSDTYTPNWSGSAYVLHAEAAGQRGNLSNPRDMSSSTASVRSFSTGDGSVSTEAKQPDGSSTKPSLPLQQHRENNVTLICFGPPVELISQLQALPEIADVNQILQHPDILWEIILYNLSISLDNELWDLTEVFATEQRNLGYLTGHPSRSLSDIEFSGIHLLVDHMILILEGANGLMATIDALIDYHEAKHGLGLNFVERKTRDALKYRRRFVQSIVERGTTFEKRISNMISLFFSHVSLQDSGLLMRDSSSLRSIALLTLVFLPVTTVATICGSEFVYMAGEADGFSTIKMHRVGWYVLLGCGLTTLLLIGAWFLYLNWLEKYYTRGQLTPRRNPPQASPTV